MLHLPIMSLSDTLSDNVVAYTIRRSETKKSINVEVAKIGGF